MGSMHSPGVGGMGKAGFGGVGRGGGGGGGGGGGSPSASLAGIRRRRWSLLLPLPVVTGVLVLAPLLPLPVLRLRFIRGFLLSAPALTVAALSTLCVSVTLPPTSSSVNVASLSPCLLCGSAPRSRSSCLMYFMSGVHWLLSIVHRFFRRIVAFQWFFTLFSVLSPPSCAAMAAHRLPICLCNSTRLCSSVASHILFLVIPGRRWFSQRSRHCLPVRFVPSSFATMLHCVSMVSLFVCF
mmetsp:Transcript_8805/g.23694  ORF Transcript_8805/g.23694 Transcript_8805/m.23694 type:complete len:239 (-) Transcript_8805:144-860(-)